MAAISRRRVSALFRDGLNGGTTTEQGRILEDLICYVFSRVSGISIFKRNILNVFDTEEIDVAFWNDRLITGLPFLPNVLLVECKNWHNPVGSQEVSYFANRLRNRGCDFGILVATNGITGTASDLTAARFQMATALREGQRIMVITREELEELSHSRQLSTLLKRKICELVVSGTTLV